MADLRKLDIHTYDAKIGIWQEDANDPSFKRDVFGDLIRLLRARGWTIGVDRDVQRRHPCISDDFRSGVKGELRAALRVSGRAIELELWSENWRSDNRNGHRYCSDRLLKMPYLTRLRVQLTFAKIVAWARQLADVKYENRTRVPKAPDAAISEIYAESWHTDKALGRPICRYDDDSRTADGGVVKHGQIVWIADPKGRLCRGRAFYHVNNMWFVVCGGTLRNLSSRELYARVPADLRRKRNDDRRRVGLEAELSRAICGMDFRRAELLRRILFGDEAVYAIWSTKQEAFYRPLYNGYTADRLNAGRYTRAEAAAEVGRVPHILVAVAPDGSRINAGDFSKQAAHA